MWLNILGLALREIRRNLLRSFLTILGIVIGVAAVITMVTVGRGATQAVSDQITSLGTNLLMVRPGQRLGPGRDAAGSPRYSNGSSTFSCALVRASRLKPWKTKPRCLRRSSARWSRSSRCTGTPRKR